MALDISDVNALEFAKIWALAINVFGDEASAKKWFISPVKVLGDRKPIEVITSPEGMEMVSDLLNRIARGVFT